MNNIISPKYNLTFEQLKIYYSSIGIKRIEDIKLLTDDKKYNYLAYLLADNNEISIKIKRHFDTDRDSFIEELEHGHCSLIKATKSVLNRLNIENKTMAKITSKERIEKKLVDPIALREAVINAVVHNDYTKEVPPVFEIFSDRIQITSYGGLPIGLSQEDFFNCRSMSRNRELMRVFKDVGLVEQLGSGMSRILKTYDKSIFDISENFLIVTFKFEKVAIKSGDKTISKKYMNQKSIIIDYLQNNEKAKSSDFLDVLDVKISRIKIILARMIDENIIIAEGSNRNKIYQLKK